VSLHPSAEVRSDTQSFPSLPPPTTSVTSDCFSGLAPYHKIGFLAVSSERVSVWRQLPP